MPAFQYTTTAKQLVAQFKFNGKRAIAKDLVKHIQTYPTVSDATILVHIPTATSRVRLRGYDHAKLLAKALSYNSGVPYYPALRRTSQAHQVGLGKASRIKNVVGAFKVVNARAVWGAHVVLVDDVVTTGATLNEAARVLRAAGAKQVDAVVFAQTPK